MVILSLWETATLCRRILRCKLRHASQIEINVLTEKLLNAARAGELVRVQRMSKDDSKKVLWENVSRLMIDRYGKETARAWPLTQKLAPEMFEVIGRVVWMGARL